MKENKNNQTGFTLVEIMIVVAVVAILLSIVIPNYIKARQTGERQVCIANLKQIESAKVTYALETPSVGTSEMLMGSLVPDYIKTTPECPLAGTYSIGNFNAQPTCSNSGAPYLHRLR